MFKNIFKSFLTHIYLLQLEEYSITRYLKCIFKHKFQPLEQFKKGIRWSHKLVIVTVMSLLVQVLGVVGVGIVLTSFSREKSLVILIAVFVLVILVKIQFVFLVLSVLLVLPIDKIAKSFVIHRARKLVRKNPHLTIIGITGSYGKTTMKEMLKVILGSQFRVLATPDNVNTDIGVAQFILRELNNDIEILVIEMGAYLPGDIRRLCSIIQPDISILTGINESHLERFRKISNIIKTKFEIVTYAKKDAYVVLNADNSYIIESAQEYVYSHDVAYYSYLNHELTSYHFTNKHFHSDGSGWSFDLMEDGRTYSFKIPFLGEYSVGTVMGAVCVARRLGMGLGQIRHAAQGLQPILHRLQPIRTQNVLVIDDSYNGNPEGVKEAIQSLRNLSGNRKIFITPGLVETGSETLRIHREIGEQLADAVTHVFLITNSVTPYVSQGLELGGFASSNIYWCSDFQDVQCKLKQFISPGDVLLFQNDWPENYL